MPLPGVIMTVHRKNGQTDDAQLRLRIATPVEAVTTSAAVVWCTSVTSCLRQARGNCNITDAVKLS